MQQIPGKKGSTLPEYLEAHEVQAVLTAAPHSRARLLFLLQWRANSSPTSPPSLRQRKREGIHPLLTLSGQPGVEGHHTQVSVAHPRG